MFVTHVPLTYPSSDPLAWMATVSGPFGLRKLSQGTSFSLSLPCGAARPLLQADSQAMSPGPGVLTLTGHCGVLEVLPGKDHSWAGVDRQGQAIVEIHVVQPVLGHLPRRVPLPAVATHPAWEHVTPHLGIPSRRGPFTRSCTLFHSFIPQAYTAPVTGWSLWLPEPPACPSAPPNASPFFHLTVHPA